MTKETMIGRRVNMQEHRTGTVTAIAGRMASVKLDTDETWFEPWAHLQPAPWGRLFFVNYGPDTRHLNKTEHFGTFAEAQEFARGCTAAYRLTSQDYTTEWAAGSNERVYAEVVV